MCLSIRIERMNTDVIFYNQVANKDTACGGSNTIQPLSFTMLICNLQHDVKSDALA